MKLNCPNCGKSLKAKDDARGKKGCCPECKTAMIIPSGNGGRRRGAPEIHPTASQKTAKPLNNNGKYSSKAVNIEEYDFWSYINDYIQNVIRSDNPNQIFLKHVGFWWRCFQYVIDVLPLLFLLALFSRPIARFTVYFQNQEDMLLVGKIVLTVFFVIFMLLYWSIMEASRFQGSLGKIALDFKVIDNYGQPISFTSALIRNCLKILQFIPPLFLLFMLIMFSKNKQGLHDRFTGSMVVLGGQGVIWYYERRWLVLWFVFFLPFGLLVLAL